MMTSAVVAGSGRLPVYGTEDVARVARQTPETVLAARRAKRIAGKRCGRRWLFSRAAVAAYIGCDVNDLP